MHARTSPVRQINWKTAQQDVSQTACHHRRRTSKTILTRTRLTASMSVRPSSVERMFEMVSDAELIDHMGEETR
ncbi:hypothetical protein, partial [Mycolicibacterium elephantis]|uniref:hypothetical protein n=1 Tax=Mycolicibacterium elephantis TaxID=81858 RepID=UPI001A963BE4